MSARRPANRHERRVLEWAARHMHAPGRCVFVIDRVDELPPLRIPEELNRRRMKCLICGRVPEPDDIAEVIGRAPNDAEAQA